MSLKAHQGKQLVKPMIGYGQRDTSDNTTCVFHELQRNLIRGAPAAPAAPAAAAAAVACSLIAV